MLADAGTDCVRLRVIVSRRLKMSFLIWASSSGCRIALVPQDCEHRGSTEPHMPADPDAREPTGPGVLVNGGLGEIEGARDLRRIDELLRRLGRRRGRPVQRRDCPTPFERLGELLLS